MYEHGNYAGWEESVKETRNGTVMQENDEVSSLRVTPGCTFTAYRHFNLDSFMFNATTDMRNVGSQYNDAISSFTCTCGKLKFFQLFSL